MTDYTAITGIERGFTAFTSTRRRQEKPESAADRNRRLNRENYQRKAKDITKFHHAPAFNVALASPDDSRRTAAIKGR